MRLHRGILAAIVIVALTFIATAAIITLGLTSKPDPQTAHRNQLIRYLALGDITTEPEAFQRGMVDRMSEEIRAGLSGEGSGMLPEKNRQRLEANALHLKKRWFVWRVNEYAELKPEDRAAFLNREIETVLAWAKLENELKAKDDDSQGASAAVFFDDIKTWMAEETDAAQRDRMEVGVRDGLVQWLATRDLAEQPLAVRRELALRVAASLANRSSDSSPVKLTGGRSEEEQSQLRANGLLLVEAWLLDRARQFAPLNAFERIAFVDQQIDEVLSWNLQTLVPAAGGQTPVNPLEHTAKALAEIEAMIQRAPAEDQTALREMANVAQARIAMRWLTGSLRIGS